MKLKSIYTLVLFCTFAIQSFAQCCGSQEKMIQQITASPFYIYYTQYEGKPFYLNEWQNASVTVLSGETYQNLKVKFDLYKGNFIYYNESLKKLLIIDNEIVTDVHLFNENNSEIAWITKYCNDPKDNCEFYFVHHSDSISLYSRHRKKIEKYNGISGSVTYLGGFYSVVKNELLINNNFISIPKGKRALANLFPSNKKELLSYINKNHLKVKDINNLALVIAKANELEKKQPSIYLEKRNWRFWKKEK